MNKIILLLLSISLFLLTACVRTNLDSINDAANTKTISRTLVVAYGMDIGERKDVENSLVESLIEKDVNAFSSINIFPPLRDYSDEEFSEKINSLLIDSILFFEVTGKSVSTAYLPPQYHAGTSHSTVNVVGNTAHVTTTQNPSYTTGGGTIEKPVGSYSMRVNLLPDNNTIWMANGDSEGSAFHSYSSVSVEVAKEVVNMLVNEWNYS